MADEPPSYDNSVLDTKKASSPSGEPVLTSSTKDSKDIQSGNASPLASTSKSAVLLQNDSGPSPKRKSFLTGLLRKLPHSGSIESIVMKDVCNAVQPYSDSAADRVAILGVCTELCTRHSIEFSRFQQGEAVQGHTVLYWAIINSPWPPRAPFELVGAVLAHSAPLKPETIREARRACVSLRSQEMFHFLRMRPISDRTHQGLEIGTWSGTLAITENSASTGVRLGIGMLAARPSPSTPAHHWIYASTDKPLTVSGPVNDAKKVTILFAWRLFERDVDSVFIAPDGSVTGVLGVKLELGKMQPTIWPPRQS